MTPPHQPIRNKVIAIKQPAISREWIGRLMGGLQEGILILIEQVWSYDKSPFFYSAR